MLGSVETSDLEEWLIANGVDEVRGYGHICAEDLADRMLKAMTMKWKGRDEQLDRRD